MIELLDVTFYPRGPGNYWSEKHVNPTWELTESELLTMDPFEKPIVCLQRHRNIPDSDLMMVNGGNGVYHLQHSDGEAKWIQAFDPNGSDEEVDVWTSDQGFATARKYTWPAKDALAVLKYFFENATTHPDYKWE